MFTIERVILFFLSILFISSCSSSDATENTIGVNHDDLFLEMPETVPDSAIYTIGPAKITGYKKDLSQAHYYKEQIQKGGGDLQGAWKPVNTESSVVYHFNDEGYVFKSWDADLEGNRYVNDPGLYKQDDGLLWATMEMRKDVDQGHSYQSLAATAQDTITTMYSVDQDTLWIATDAGYNQFINHDIVRETTIPKEFFEDTLFVRVDAEAIEEKIIELEEIKY